jgi:hypothetical protein
MSRVAANVQQYLHDSANSFATPLDLPITATEVSDCLQRLRSGKAGNPAEEGIVNELLKNGGNTAADMLLRYCSLMWQLEQVHQVPGTIVNMPKKGHLTDPSRRGVTLVCSSGYAATDTWNTRKLRTAQLRLSL